jgi:glycosyltransferase involved in cell wall biosynthesis
MPTPPPATNLVLRALLAAAASPADRLKQKKVSFVGMWGPRKGARIWAEIIRRVREHVPDAEFCFLGTMAEPDRVLKDLGENSLPRVTSVPEYRPEELPKLLSDCAVGAFPSYVEGFGLAVIEQLAAGIPTVAFDQGGPRDILRERLPELLVAVDDVRQFADAVSKVLTLSLAQYDQLVQASVRTASGYSWPDIARDTLDKYCEAFAPRPAEAGVSADRE